MKPVLEINYRMTDRETRLVFLIDTNCINSRHKLPAMNRLEKWAHDHVIDLFMSDISHREAKASRNSKRTRKALCTGYTISFRNEPGVQDMHDRITAILFPNGCRSQRDANDARIVLNAWHYRPYILITADRAILRRRNELENLGIMVMTGAEAVALVEKRIQERDRDARADAAWSGEPLPEWVGKDCASAGHSFADVAVVGGHRCPSLGPSASRSF